MSSDGGLLLLREAERRLGIVSRLAGAICDRRDPRRIDHALPELLKTRIHRHFPTTCITSLRCPAARKIFMRVHLPTGCPEQARFSCIAARLAQAIP